MPWFMATMLSDRALPTICKYGRRPSVCVFCLEVLFLWVSNVYLILSGQDFSMTSSSFEVIGLTDLLAEGLVLSSHSRVSTVLLNFIRLVELGYRYHFKFIFFFFSFWLTRCQGWKSLQHFFSSSSKKSNALFLLSFSILFMNDYVSAF